VTEKPAPAAALREASAGKQYHCFACRVEVELKVARFCWFNMPKFGGNVYCRECQQTIS